MRCEDLAAALSAVSDGDELPARAGRHVDSCLRCQAELVQYRKLIKILHTLRTEVLAPGPSLAADILAGLEHAGERSALRSLLSSRRPTRLNSAAAVGAVALGAGAAVALRARRPTPPGALRGDGARGRAIVAARRRGQ